MVKKTEETKIRVKPLSVNAVWAGRRFKTKAYKDYEIEVIYSLPKLKIPKKGKLKLNLTFGVSNKNSDIDNFIKIFVDVCQKKYDFNDNRIYALDVKKEDVKKKEEFIAFNLEELNKKIKKLT